MVYLKLLRKTGIRLTFVARRMGEGESLVRYHLSQKEINPEFERRLITVLREIAADISKETRKRPLRVN